MKTISILSVIIVALVVIFGDHQVIFHTYYGKRFFWSFVALAIIAIGYTLYSNHIEKRNKSFKYQAGKVKAELDEFEEGLINLKK